MDLEYSSKGYYHWWVWWGRMCFNSCYWWQWQIFAFL